MMRVLVLSVVCVLFALPAAIAQPAPAATQSSVEQPPPTSAPGQQPLTIDRVLEAARQMKNEGRFAEAQELMEALILRDPGNVDAKIILGEIAEARRDGFGARKWYKEVLDVQPNEFRANLGMGRTYVASQYWRQAVSFLETAERVAPPDRLGDAREQLALAYRGSGQATKALETAERAVQASPNSLYARQILVSLRIDLEQFERALGDTVPLIQIAQDTVRDNAGDPQKLRELLGVYSTRLAVLREYHNTLFERASDGRVTDRPVRGKEKEVAEILKQVVDLLIYQSTLQQTLAAYDIIPIATQAVGHDPENPELLLRLGLLYKNTSQRDMAVSTLQKLLSVDPKNSEARDLLEQMNASPTAQSAPPPGDSPISAPAAP